jgi:hypothetical protein
MFRKRALQELTEIVAGTDDGAREQRVEPDDPQVATVRRIQDLLGEVGVDPGEDPVEAARVFLNAVDTKLPGAPPGPIYFGGQLPSGDPAPPAPVAPPAEFAPPLSTPAPLMEAPAGFGSAFQRPAPPTSAPMPPVPERAADVPPAPEPGGWGAVPVAAATPEQPAPPATNDAAASELAAQHARIEELQAAVLERARQRDEIREQLDSAHGRIRQLEGSILEQDHAQADLMKRVAELEIALEQAHEDAKQAVEAAEEARQAQETAAAEAQAAAADEVADLDDIEFTGELAPTFEDLADAVARLEMSLATGEQAEAEARHRIDQQEARIAELTAERDEARNARADAEARGSQLASELAMAQRALSAVTDDENSADEVRDELTRLRAELDRVQADLRTTHANEAAASLELERRRAELADAQSQLAETHDALRATVAESEATQRRVTEARAQADEAEAGRDSARSEAARVIELAMRQAAALRVDAERQADAARILNEAANEVFEVHKEAQREATAIREKAVEAADAARGEETEYPPTEQEPVAPAILSALITRVASIESHLSHQRERNTSGEQSGSEDSTAEAAVDN